MKLINLTRRFLLSGAAAFAISSASAALVTWELNPDNLNQNVGGPTRTYTISGIADVAGGQATIIARGYDNIAGPDPFHDLFYKFQAPVNGAGERGLGLVNTNDNELQVNPDGSPAQYIQLDLSSILLQGFTGGEIMIGSLQAGEEFRLFGSNAQGELGTQLGGTFGSAFDEKFVAIPSFGSFQFISIASAVADSLPVAFRAFTPVPEMCALIPILALISAIGGARLLRRSRA